MKNFLLTVGLFSTLALSCFGDGFVNGGAGGTNIINYFFPAAVTVSNVVSLPFGANAAVTVSGTSNQVWQFSVPRGSNGVAGANGTNGTNGTNGATGPQGAAGATGATGPQGATGVTGPTGSTGSTGLQGQAGTNGVAVFTFTSIATSSQFTLIGRQVSIINASLVCITNDGGLTVGQSVPIFDVQDASFSEPYFFLGSDSTKLFEGSVSTSPSVARIIWNGTRNMVVNWSDFNLVVIYQ